MNKTTYVLTYLEYGYESRFSSKESALQEAEEYLCYYYGEDDDCTEMITKDLNELTQYGYTESNILSLTKE